VSGEIQLLDEQRPLPHVEPLLRVEFDRSALNVTDTPLQFVVHELGAIVERAPEGLKLEINTARKITVVIFAE
jgi:hypothetical protein